MNRIEIRPDAPVSEEIVLTDALAASYDLDAWANRFSLMTAGYRDRLDPDDAANPQVPFNLLTVAIMAEAKARVFARKLSPGETGHVHIGGEVRPHTQQFIQVIARIYAAKGYIVHLRKEVSTTPIWYSSFGICFEGLQTGDNLTASHSPYFKGGWKALDSEGKQITVEEAEIIAETREVVSSRAVIKLAPWSIGGRIRKDFDLDLPYSSYQRSVLGADLLTNIVKAQESGFRCLAAPLGGSMGATSRRLFDALGLIKEGSTRIGYFLDAEDSRFHRVGEIGGENYGADAGNAKVYRNVAARAAAGPGSADLILIWDPDGDRLNVVTYAPVSISVQAEELGLEVERKNGSDTCIVYFTPNQLYLVLIAYRIELLKRAGRFGLFGWFIGASFPISMAILELARLEAIPLVRVPVGFRHVGDICRVLEEHGDVEPFDFVTVTDEVVRLKPKPRALFLCEESGGAGLGGEDVLKSKSGRKAMLALREKDGMQLALLVLGAAAEFRMSGKSFAERYCELLVEKKIRYRYSTRHDLSLFDESLTGSDLQTARQQGTLVRDALVAFFRGIVEEMRKGALSPQEASARISKAGGDASAPLPPLRSAHWIGDGSMFEWEGVRLIVRASGTDALMRYYLDATDKGILERFAALVRGLRV